MNIIVCVKQVNDPEAPPSSFKIDSAANKVIPPPSMPPVISTFDEYAVEAALRIKEKVGGKITALSLGINLLRDVVKNPSRWVRMIWCCWKTRLLLMVTAGPLLMPYLWQSRKLASSI